MAVAENGLGTDTIPAIADTSRSPETAAQPEGRKRRASGSGSAAPPEHPAELGGSWAQPAPPPQHRAPVGRGQGGGGQGIRMCFSSAQIQGGWFCSPDPRSVVTNASAAAETRSSSLWQDGGSKE